MNKKIRRRIASIAACAMLLTSVPLAQFPAMAAAGDLLIDDAFAGGVGDWDFYKESGGACKLATSDGKLAFTISSVGTKNYAVQLNKAIIPLYEGARYRLTFDISCTTERYVECMLQQAGGDYTAYVWQGLSIGPTAQTVEKEFTMEYPDDIMAKLVFNCGLQEKDPTLPEHTIYLDNVKLEVLDDSGVNYSSEEDNTPAVKTNQVGYRTTSKKTVTVRNAGSESSFKVVNAATKQAVKTFDLSAEMNNASAGETDKVGDFSSITTPGTYYIEVGSLGKSYEFTIGDDVYDAMLADSVKMLYLQRCGCEVQDATFGHVACHNTQAKVYGTNNKIDVNGGWHDAGDYGRYVVAGAKAVGDLMYAYLANPAMYNDKLGIPESGNGTPDILDEVKYELDWMMKMQTSDGGVYHKVSCAGFPGFIMPEKETEELIVMPVSTTATADFAASMALASEVFAKYDPTYAKQCLAAAEKAWGFLEKNGYIGYTNPADVVTGEYGDKTDVDERYWAAAQLWRTTGSDTYKNYIESKGASDGLDWSTVGDYGNIAILTWDGVDTSSKAYTNAKSTILKEADSYKSRANSSAYGVAIAKYNWGSNMSIANAGITLGLAAQLTGDASYMAAADQQLNYLLGNNPTGYSFMTGYGTVTPQNPHHRPSGAKKQAMKGMLVGGVNSALEDDAAKAYCAGKPAALCYIDNTDSYSTNEITIYWNSPLTYLVTVTADGAAASEDPTEPTNAQDPTQADPGNTRYGDVNEDGKVDILDVISLNKNLMVGDPITAQGKINADVDRNGSIDEVDSLNILKFIVELIDKLPIGDAVEPTQAPTQPTEAPTEATEAPTQQQGNAFGIEDKGTPMMANQKMVSDFRTGDAGDFFASNGWTNGSCFDCWWHESNTSLDGGCLTLTIDKDKGDHGMYSGAEYRTNEFYHYGYYECSMQAIKCDGVVSSFFTYTGPSDKINGVENPWDEIDIEILGKDTTKMQINYYHNAKGGHEVMIDLGFDASEAFHTYGFDWYSDHITWYVDGKEVHTMNGEVPQVAGKIMMNTWPGVSDPNNKDNVIDWLKVYPGTTPVSAHYQWVTYGANKN